MDSLFLTVNDIVLLKGVCYRTACNIFNNIIEKYELPKERELSTQAFCSYYKISEEKVIALLEKKRAKNSLTKPKSTTILDKL
ncbi:hypothetical protein KO494_08560 [Lacinutrix sp. C3R15]|uniref:hypothetical protein n=1 Tax=Flavobacteriaceae TaxID=49546 RepID=UPI001C095C77|nr:MULTISPECIES: hypothetical protein [Flavobacteriaceae]MBU2939592.1 hypothetical protein [Lacinutrix sp. C3R15]MDO6622906.1 hypothetical protein [Oceanihabitans sp. 1_MG-2023]